MDHTTLDRSAQTQRYAPKVERRLRWSWCCPRPKIWRVDETSVRVRGRWICLCRAVDRHGDAIDLHLSPTHDAKAAKRLPQPGRCVG